MEPRLHPLVKVAHALTALEMALGIVGCARGRTLDTTETQTPPQTQPVELNFTQTVPENKITPTNPLQTKIFTATPTETQTPPPTPEIVLSQERAMVRNVMTEYGQVDEKYLTDQYWQRMQDRINEQGKAERVLSLEYHGDNYSMVDGAYSMTPEHFEKQIRYLMDNGYHFVTTHELLGYLQGWLNLPAKSIILTTDSGNTSNKSFPRITELFRKLEQEYGYPPHMQSYIWTNQMAEGESVLCEKDACWNMFRNAKDSGYFTFGTHSESHKPFENLTPEKAIADLSQSKQEILANLGLNVYGITWPHESCFSDSELLKNQAGILFGFGGRTRPIDINFTYANDPMPNKLPRNFPPNPSGYSSRPDGFTWEDMLLQALHP